MFSRLTIGGLMAGVLVAAMGLAALRSGSETWSSVTFLVTSGVLAFGIVAVVCGGKAARPWWVGFVVFGWGYLSWAFWGPEYLTWQLRPPSLELLRAGGLRLANPGGKLLSDYAEDISHCLCALLFGAAGGLLARVIYPAHVVPIVPDPEGPGARPASRRWAWRPAIVGLAGLGLLMAAVVAGSRTAPGLWAGVTVLVTWGLLGLAAIGAVANRGLRRARWLATALFGMGYLMLISGHSYTMTWPHYATTRLLNRVRPWLPPIPNEAPLSADSVVAANFRVLQALDRTIPMRFPEETPLEDVVTYLAAATRGPDGRDLPIYVDPVGLQEAEKTLRSPVTFVLEGVPLRSSLPLLLAQLGMRYDVKDGVLVINDQASGEYLPDPVHQDPFLLTGHCVLALLAAGLGFAMVPLVYRPSGQATEP